MTDRVALLIGTPKGAFILDGDASRRDWSVRGPLCEGWPIHDISVHPESGALLAGGGSPWYGPAVWRSDDIGETWSHSSEGLTYGDDGPKVTTVWNITPGIDALYAGARGYIDAIVYPEDTRTMLGVALRTALNNRGPHLGPYVLPARPEVSG